MVRRLIGRGVLAGALGGLLAFVFARIMAEPLIQRSIDYESAREAAQAALDRAAGLATAGPEPEVFSRTVQADAGMGVGLVLFGAAMGALLAVAYAICLGRTGRLRPRTLSVLVAAGGFVALYLVPFLKYPANPPAIGHGDSVRARSELYLTMVGGSVLLLALAVWLGVRLAARAGSWNATLVAGLAFAAGAAILMLLLPPLGELPDNVARFGRQATETPQPLTAPDGRIVFPGFPADLLYGFRLYSLATQAILWAAIGLAFAPMAERLLAPRPLAALPEREPLRG